MQSGIFNQASVILTIHFAKRILKNLIMARKRIIYQCVGFNITESCHVFERYSSWGILFNIMA